MTESEKSSREARLAAKVRRLIQPDELKGDEPWLWSAGAGRDVWEMFRTCITGDLESVKRLLAKDPALVRSHYEYRTPLSFAVRENQLEIAELLLQHESQPLGVGGDLIETARHRGYSEMERLLEDIYSREYGVAEPRNPVAVAIRELDAGKVRSLLDASPELLHKRDETFNQPIHWAVMTRQLDIIDELLSRGGDINARRADGARPIHLTNGDYSYRGWRDVPESVTTTPDEVYRHLVQRGAEVDLGMACAKGDIDRVRELLDADGTLVNRVSDYGSYYLGCGAPIKNAAATGHIEIVRLLLERGADPNLPEEQIAPRGHALYSAVANRNYEMAKLLLDHGAIPNVEVESSADTVSRAIMNGDLEMIRLLASHGATWEMPIRLNAPLTYEDMVNTGIGRSTSVLAAYSDIETAAARFSSNPALANDPDALKTAAEKNQAEFVRLMLQYQPGLAKEVTVSRPREMAELLFANGMDPNRPNWLLIRPLHHFARMGDLESAALFLEHGADIGARDEEHEATPLGWAARSGQIRMVEFLLRRGAKTSLPDQPSWATAGAYASAGGHKEIVSLLREYERSGRLPVHTREEYESLTRDLVEAYRSANDTALRPVMRMFQVERMMTWDKAQQEEHVRRLRRFVCERLEKECGEELAEEDAQRLVALAHGYRSWEELMGSASKE